jgi:predicted acetyltransferase
MRGVLSQLGFSKVRLAPIGRSLILNYPGVSWRIDTKTKDIFIMYKCESGA